MPGINEGVNPLNKDATDSDSEVGHLTLMFCDLVGSTTLSSSLDAEVRIVQCYCSPYHQNTALHPVIDMMGREIFKIEAAGSQNRTLNQIEVFVKQNGMSIDQTVPLFATLFSIPVDNLYKPLPLNAERKKQKTVEAESSFMTAPNISRKRKSVSLELRTAGSSSRLCQNQDETEKAKKLLSDSTDLYTEGFDTPDSMDSREFLEKL
jgi:hypothetical protein